MLTVSGLGKSLDGYLPEPGQRLDPCAMPLEALDFSGLAPAFIGMAGIDPLRDHGVAYGQALREAGGEAEVHVVDGLVHSGLRAFGVARVEQLWDAIADWLRSRSSGVSR